MNRFLQQPLHRWLGLVFGALVAAEGANLALVRGFDARAGISDTLQTVVAVLATASFVAATRRLRRDGSDAALGWMLLCAGAACFVAGQAVFLAVHYWNGGVGFPNPSDPFYLMGYAILMLALTRLFRERLSRREWWNAAVDLAIVMLVGGVVIWEWSLHDLVQRYRLTRDASSTVALTYAVLNLALLAGLAFRLVASLGRGRMYVANALLMGAGIFLTLADLAMGHVAGATLFYSGSWIDLAWLAAASLAGLAALHVLDHGDRGEAERRTVLPVIWSAALSYTCLAFGVALFVWVYGQGGVRDYALVATASVIAVVLTGVRHLSMLREVTRLSARLEASHADLERKVHERTTELAVVGDALGATAQQQRQLYAHMQEGFSLNEIITDADGRVVDFRILDANDAYERHSGFKPADVIGRTLLEILPQADLRQIEMYGKVALTGEPSAFEYYSTAYQRHMSVRAFCPQPRRFAVIFEDITERRLAEESLRESEARYRMLFEQAGDYILVIEVVPGGPPLIRDVNELALRTFGYTREELVGQSIALLEPDITPDLLEQRKKESQTTPTLSFEVQHRRKDGSTFDAEVRSTAFAVDGKQFAISIERDISDRKRAEAERVRLESELAQAQKMESVGRLAGGVAHDFNNMLGVIIGHAEMSLAQVEPDQPLHDDLSQILTAAQRSADLTRQLLTFARRQTVMPRVIDLNQTVAGTLRMLGRLIGEDVALEWQAGSELWPVRMDPSQLDQILANLCVNARDAITGVGRIVISTSNQMVAGLDVGGVRGVAPGDYVCLSVSDDGCGMDSAIIDSIFEPFFTTKAVGKGTGLGLATVYGAMRQNNGYVDVVSVPGAGSTFTLFLPRYEGVVGAAKAAGATEPALRGHETVLIVEDEPAFLALTARTLERLGYRVLTAATPGDAIRQVSQSPDTIDLLVTDVIMPEMNGNELAERLRHLRPSMRRLFMSGYAADVISENGALAPGLAFLSKPFAPHALAAKVRQVLDQGALLS